MRAMREVNINWKMLTNLRPDNKADEIFFAQWESDKLNIFLLLVYVVVILRIRLRTGYYRLVDLERLKRSTRREEEEARVSREQNYFMFLLFLDLLWSTKLKISNTSRLSWAMNRLIRGSSKAQKHCWLLEVLFNLKISDGIVSYTSYFIEGLSLNFIL